LKNQNYILKGKAQLPKGLSSNDGDFSRATPFFSDPISFFIGKNVVVKADHNNVVVTGRLIHYQMSGREKPHTPSVLVLENPQGRLVLRGSFVSIAKRDKP